jgi:hypothetical protein
MRKLTKGLLSKEYDGITTYAPGVLYMKRMEGEGKFKKVKLLNIHIENIKKEERYENRVYIEYAFVENEAPGKPQRDLLDIQSFWSRAIPHCWRCPKTLDEDIMDYCSKCGWIICPECGACENGCNKSPNWYKKYKVKDGIKEFYAVSFIKPDNPQKENILAGVLLTSALGTFVFDGFYDKETDCVSVKPKYVKKVINDEGKEDEYSAMKMNDDLHAFVLQALDSILS